MKKRNPTRTKKNSAKRSVSKAVRYDDGREEDAIGRSLRRFAGEGFVNNQERIARQQQMAEEARKRREEKDKKKDKGDKGDDNGDENQDDTKKKNIWDVNSDGKLGKGETRRRDRYFKDADADGDGKITKDERKDARKDYRKDLREEEQKEEERDKRKKADKRNQNIDEFKKQRAARMDRIADQYNQRVDALIEKGYPERDALVKAAYNRTEDIGKVGSKDLNKAQSVTRSVIDQYKDAKKYDKTNFKDIEKKADKASDYDKVGFKDVERMAKDADYEKTKYGDLERKADKLSDYEGAEFDSENYTSRSLEKRMSPYEELVAKRARKRLKRDYEEGRAQRETEAARAGAFGGSAAAVKEIADRRNYRDALKDYNAESLQKAYESAANLTNLADDSRYRAQAAEEQSRQYGADMGMKGWEAQLSARNATSNEEARKSQQQLAQAAAVGDARKASAAEEANQTQYSLAGVEQIQKARDSAANETARAKEAQFSGIAGQGAGAAQLGSMSDQELRQYMSKTDAMNNYGNQAMQYQLDKQEYPLDLMERNLNINTSAVSGTPLNTTVKASEPSTAEKWIGYGLAAASAAGSVANAANTVAGWLGAAGGVATPQGFRRSSPIVNLANGGIIDLHNAMFRRK